MPRYWITIEVEALSLGLAHKQAVTYRPRTRIVDVQEAQSRPTTDQTDVHGSHTYTHVLDAFERWMVRSNLETIRKEGLSAEAQAALVRRNGYPTVAQAIEELATTPEEN